MEFKVSPIVSPDLDLDKSIFNMIEEGQFTNNAKSYVFDDDIDLEFYLLDQNGNLSIERCVVMDVDGVVAEPSATDAYL